MKYPLWTLSITHASSDSMMRLRNPGRLYLSWNSELLCCFNENQNKTRKLSTGDFTDHSSYFCSFFFSQVSLRVDPDHRKPRPLLRLGLLEEWFQQLTFAFWFLFFCWFSARGGDLSGRMDGDSLSEFEAVKILKQVLEGVKFMHDSGFMHLDLKVSVRTNSREEICACMY